jgi:hypothetical protein
MILMRRNLADENEYAIAAQHFPVVELRTQIEPTLIIPRYSALPYYDELEQDVTNMGGTLINSYKQHKWIANFEYYQPLKNFTFKTWDEYNFVSAPDIPYVVKGRTNSKKFSWDRLMYAPNKKQAIQIGLSLYEDELIGRQGIIYREYIKLKKLYEGINGMPITNEWRFFFYKTHLLTHGFYWANLIDDSYHAVKPESLKDFALKIAKIASHYANFFVLDIAETDSGEPILVEINDGSMSGLSGCDADELYESLSSLLTPSRVM